MTHTTLIREKTEATVETHERLRRLAVSADARRGVDITQLSHEERIRLARGL